MRYFMRAMEHALPWEQVDAWLRDMLIALALGYFGNANAIGQQDQVFVVWIA